MLHAARLRWVLALAVVVPCASLTPSALGQVILDEPPPEERGVGITAPEPGTPLPLDAELVDERGRAVTLGDFFDGERPVLLMPAYYDCPLLCGVMLNHVERALAGMRWTPGKEFRVVTFSFDPGNTTEMAQSKQNLHLRGLGDDIEDPHEAWAFLTTDGQTARRICDALGYRYNFIPAQREYAHVAGLYFIRPDGTINTFIEGLEYTPTKFTIGLSEAAEGRIGTIFDRVALSCFRYDPQTGEYVISPMAVMRIGASGVAVLLVGVLAALFVRDRLRRGAGGAAVSPG